MGQFDNLFKEIGKDKPQESKKTEKGSSSLAKPKKKKINVTKKAKPTKKLVDQKTPKLPPKTQQKVAGKSSNLDYKQVLTYMKKDTHRRAKIALLNEDKSRDLSDLVEELVSNWLKRQ